MKQKERIRFLLCFIGLMDDANLPFHPSKLSKKHWHRLFKDAENHRVSPLLYYNLKRKNEISIPDELKTNLESSYLKNSLDNTRLFYSLSNILISTEKENIPIIALKGAYIACQFYPNVALRPMYDLDLLVKSEYATKMHNLLLGLEWVCNIDQNQFEDYIRKHEVIKYTNKLITLELHSGIIEIANTDVWNNVFPTKIGKNDIFVLDHNVLLPYLCIHLCEHLRDLFVEIIRIYDVVQIIRQCRGEIDWNKVIQIAEENQSKNDVYRVLYFIKNELGEDIPDDVLSRLNENRHELTILQALYKGKKIREINPIGHIIKAIQARIFDPKSITIGKIAKLIISSIFPDKKYMIEKYKPKYSWLFFVYYPIRTVLGIRDIIKSLLKK
jgi:hypothetical protein